MHIASNACSVRYSILELACPLAAVMTLLAQHSTRLISHAMPSDRLHENACLGRCNAVVATPQVGIHKYRRLGLHSNVVPRSRLCGQASLTFQVPMQHVDMHVHMHAQIAVDRANEHSKVTTHTFLVLTKHEHMHMHAALQRAEGRLADHLFLGADFL